MFKWHFCSDLKVDCRKGLAKPPTKSFKQPINLDPNLCKILKVLWGTCTANLWVLTHFSLRHWLILWKDHTCRVSTGPGCKARARLMSCAAYAKNLRGGSGIQLTSYSATPVQCRRAVLQALRHSDSSLKKYWKNTKKKIWTVTGNSGVVCEDKSGCNGLKIEPS